MLDEYARFEKEGLVVDVNWNEAVKPCKYIRFKMNGDSKGGQAIIPNIDFYGMMMFFGTPKQEINADKPTSVPLVLYINGSVFNIRFHII